MRLLGLECSLRRRWFAPLHESLNDVFVTYPIPTPGFPKYQGGWWWDSGADKAPEKILLSRGLRLQHFVNGGSGCACEAMDLALCLTCCMQCTDLFV